MGTQKGLHLWALQAPVVERIGEVVDVVLEVLGFLVRKVLVLGVVIIVHPGGEGRDLIVRGPARVLVLATVLAGILVLA